MDPKKVKGRMHVPTILQYEFPTLVHRYTWKDVSLYALAVGAGAKDPCCPRELALLYEGRGEGEAIQVLPTFAVTLIPDLTVALTKVPTLRFDPRLLLHGEHELVCCRPLPPQATVVGASRVIAVVDKGKAAVVVVETVSREEASGEVLFVNRATVFLRGAGGFTKATATPGNRNTDETPASALPSYSPSRGLEKTLPPPDQDSNVAAAPQPLQDASKSSYSPYKGLEKTVLPSQEGRGVGGQESSVRNGLGGREGNGQGGMPPSASYSPNEGLGPALPSAHQRGIDAGISSDWSYSPYKGVDKIAPVLQETRAGNGQGGTAPSSYGPYKGLGPTLPLSQQRGTNAAISGDSSDSPYKGLDRVAPSPPPWDTPLRAASTSGSPENKLDETPLSPPQDVSSAKGQHGEARGARPAAAAAAAATPRSKASPWEVPTRDPDATHEEATAPSQALLYRLCGDPNPLHADPAVAAAAGYGVQLFYC